MAAAAIPQGRGRGKSGLHRAGCQITSGGGDSRDSATEMYRLFGCGLKGKVEGSVRDYRLLVTEGHM